MGDVTWQTVKAIGTLPVKVYHVGAGASSGLEERDPNGPMSVVGAGRVAGEVASATRTSRSTTGVFLLIAARRASTCSSALFNLVPLLPFDGGDIAGALYEAVRRGIARLRGRPDPGYVDSAKLLPVTYVMAAVILVMSVVLIFADIVAPVSHRR